MNKLRIRLSHLIKTIALSVFIVITASVVSASTNPWLCGDANNDGQIDIVDALLIAQWYVGINNIGIYAINTDVNGDLVVDIVDALLVAQYYVGLIQEFPIETAIHEFADEKVASAVRRALNKGTHDPVNKWELRGIQSLSVKSSSSSSEPVYLSDIEHMIGLCELTINNYPVSDLTPLTNLVSLQKPLLGDVEGGTITVPDYYTYLTDLDLNNTGIDDINTLGTLEILKKLVLSNNTIYDFTPLSNLSELTDLDLNNTGIDDINTLGTLEILKKLVLSNNTIYDFTPLSNLSELTYLDLDNTGINNLNPLTNLTKLTSLNLNRNNISNVNQLTPLSLKDLSLRNNALDDYDFQIIGNMTTLLSLDVSRNNITDATPLDVNDWLQILDIRDNPISDASFFFNSSTDKIRKLDLFNCSPGHFKGDADGDDAITSNDVAMVDAILSYLTPGRDYKLAPPDNIEGIDMNSNGKIDVNDLNSISNMVNTDPSDIVGFSFNTCGIKGDADGDGIVDFSDADFIDGLPWNIVNASSDIRCVDMNNDGILNSEDSDLIREMAKRRDPLQVLYQPESNEVVNILSFDYDYIRFGMGDGPDGAHITPKEYANSLHKKILTNPFLMKTDLIIASEFAYADADNPIELHDNGPGAEPRFQITNDNWTVKKVQRLMQHARTYKVNIVVSLVERVYYNSCPISFNSAIVINTKGHIAYLRRKMWKILCHVPPAGIDAFCSQTKKESFKVMELRTQNDSLFTAVLVICAEMNNPPYAHMIDTIDNYIADKEKKTIDLLLFIENQPLTKPGTELMKRIQFGAWDPLIPRENSFLIHHKTAGFNGYVDFIAYAGGMFNSIGVFAMDKQPIEYIYTNQYDNSGFVYGRITLKRSSRD